MSSLLPTSERAVGLAPLGCGLLLVQQTAGDVAGGDPWAVAGLVGGCAAVLIGVGILLGRGEFDPETGDDARAVRVLAAVAAVAFLAGVVAVVV